MSPRSRRRPGPGRDDEIFGILHEALADLRRERPEIPLEVHDKAREAVQDALMKRPSLARYPNGRINSLRIRGMARGKLIWCYKSWLRTRLRPDGTIRPGPRTATSLDAELETADGGTASSLHDRLGSDIANPERVIGGREALKELVDTARAGAEGTFEVICGYLRGDAKAEIGHLTGLTENTVSARKSRFAKRMRGHD